MADSFTCSARLKLTGFPVGYGLWHFLFCSPWPSFCRSSGLAPPPATISNFMPPPGSMSPTSGNRAFSFLAGLPGPTRDLVTLFHLLIHRSLGFCAALTLSSGSCRAHRLHHPGTNACWPLAYLLSTSHPQRAAVLGAAFYVINPNALLITYIRSDFAEQLACAFFSVLLLAALRLCNFLYQDNTAKRRSAAVWAILFAAVWLSNAPAVSSPAIPWPCCCLGRLFATLLASASSRCRFVGFRAGLGRVLYRARGLPTALGPLARLFPPACFLLKISSLLASRSRTHLVQLDRFYLRACADLASGPDRAGLAPFGLA